MWGDRYCWSYLQMFKEIILWNYLKIVVFWYMILCWLVICYQHFIGHPSLTALKREAASPFERPVTSYQSTWSHIPEDCKKNSNHMSAKLFLRFPQWAHGYWQHMYIEGNTLTYKDHSTFKTFTIRCLGPDVGIGERFPVFARTQWWVFDDSLIYRCMKACNLYIDPQVVWFLFL